MNVFICSAGNNSQGQILFASVIYQCLQPILKEECLVVSYFLSAGMFLSAVLAMLAMLVVLVVIVKHKFNLHQAFISVYNQF
jgi:hypothetical protein